MKRASEYLNIVFGWGIYVCLFAGGLAFFGFVAAIVMGGDGGQELAVMIQKQYFPMVIRAASATIGLGLISMYLGKEQALSLASDKKEAEQELAEFKKSSQKSKKGEKGSQD